jgi:hypothetical protein
MSPIELPGVRDAISAPRPESLAEATCTPLVGLRSGTIRVSGKPMPSNWVLFSLQDGQSMPELAEGWIVTCDGDDQQYCVIEVFEGGFIGEPVADEG